MASSLDAARDAGPLREGFSSGSRRTLMRAALLVMGIAAPLGSATVALGLFSILCLAFYREINGSDESRVSALGFLGPPTLLLAGAAFVSTLFTADVVNALAHAVGLTVMAAVGLMSGRVAVREEAFFLNAVIPAAIAATALSAAHALYEHFVLDVGRATALLSYTNRLATLLVFFGFIGAGYLVQRYERPGWALLPFGLLVLGGLGATLSRAGWVAAAVGLALLGLRRNKQYLVVFLVGVLLFGMALAVDDQWAHRFRSIFDLKSNQDRLTIWDASLRIFRDHPIVGAGPGSFLELSASYIPPERYRRHATPHNVVLSIASDLGVLGLLAFLWVMGRAARAAVHLWKTGGPFQIGVVTAVVSIFVNDLFGQGFYTTQIGTVMWFGLGLLAAYYEREQGQ